MCFEADLTHTLDYINLTMCFEADLTHILDYINLTMCFVMIVQIFVSVESFAANYTGETVDIFVSQCVTISIISLGECFGAKLALVSCTRVRFCAA